MAIVRYTTKKYASLEINRAAFRKDGAIVSQTPLATTFTATAPCENGMWVDANKANLTIKPVSAATKYYGIVYTSEKEYYAPYNVGLKEHCQVGGDYPNVGILKAGDTFVSNCFCYDTAEFANDAAVVTALAAATLATTPLYLVPVTTNNALKLTATAPSTGAYAQVIKKTTVPNGEVGLKYTVVKEA